MWFFLLIVTLAAAAPTPCHPQCICTATSYSCRGRNLTAFPPDMFRGWPALETIDLSANNATALPAGLFQGLSSLQSLDVSLNALSTLPMGWLAGLDALATLNLSGLPLNATFNAATMLGALPMLLSLFLGAPTLQGGGGACPDFSPLATLAPRLATLYANGLTHIPPRSFAGLKLSTLNLSRNSFATRTSGAFDGLQVTEVKLEWCSIAAIEPGAFRGLTAGNVDLYFNQITADSIPEGGLTLPGVAALCLAGNPLDSRALAKPLINSAPRLVRLDLMGGMGLGPFLGVLPPRAFASTPTLLTLQLFNSGVTGFAPGAFEGLPRLASLNVGFNLAFSALPAGLLDPLPTLQTLVVNNGALAGDGALRADAFARTPLLSVLDLSYNTPGLTSLPRGLLAGCDRLATIDLTSQAAGSLQLAPGTFTGINASGTLQGNVSITLVQNNMKSYAGFTTDAEIAAAICAEARASPATCAVAWSPQAPEPAAAAAAGRGGEGRTF